MKSFDRLEQSGEAKQAHKMCINVTLFHTVGIGYRGSVHFISFLINIHMLLTRDFFKAALRFYINKKR